MGKMKTEKSTGETSSHSHSQFKGVRKRKWGKWVSEIRRPNSRERIWLGSYDTPEKAAKAFDVAMFCLRGKSATFNFPEDIPDIPGGRSLSPSEIQTVAAEIANQKAVDQKLNCLSENSPISLLSDEGFSLETGDWSLTDFLSDSGDGLWPTSGFSGDFASDSLDMDLGEEFDQYSYVLWDF